MIPNVFKTLKLKRLCAFIMLCICCVQPTDAQSVRLVSLYNRASEKYVKIGANVTADQDHRHDLLMIMRTDPERALQFFLYDPSTKRFLCLKGKRLIGKKRIPEHRVDICSIKENIVDKIYTQYLLSERNIKMMFNNNGTQATRAQTAIRHYSKKKWSFLLNQSKNQSGKIAQFCNHMRNIKVPPEIRKTCKIRN